MNRKERLGALPFNSALETGVRALSVLVAGYPRTLDLHRLVAFDYLVVHTSDIGGPKSLHPELPLRASGVLVRRPIVERGLLLMMSRGLIERQMDAQGITYRAADLGDALMRSFESAYLSALKSKARWVVDRLADLDDDEFRATVRGKLGAWIEEFDPGTEELES